MEIKVRTVTSGGPQNAKTKNKKTDVGAPKKQQNRKKACSTQGRLSVSACPSRPLFLPSADDGKLITSSDTALFGSPTALGAAAAFQLPCIKTLSQLEQNTSTYFARELAARQTLKKKGDNLNLYDFYYSRRDLRQTKTNVTL